MRFYEGASWHEGGRILKYQETSTGLNYDIYLLDTATGGTETADHRSGLQRGCRYRPPGW